ncbi:MAG: hypothetical protein NC517_07370 [Firmicutes bacterium]|nr:hypothetical protein [Bacillota bacterium]
MRKKAGSFRFWAATVILVSVAALSFAGTVMCRTDLNDTELEGYYREKEKQLVKDTRAYLSGSGFDNSGVMLTRVLDENGSRTYTVTVHHSKIDRMQEAERDALVRELETLAFKDGSCTFYYTFLFDN